MTTPARLDDATFYDGDHLRETLGLRPGSLARARKFGEIRYSRRGGRIIYLGAWVMEWLTAEATAPPIDDAPAPDVPTPAAVASPARLRTARR